MGDREQSDSCVPAKSPDRASTPNMAADFSAHSSSTAQAAELLCNQTPNGTSAEQQSLVVSHLLKL